MEMAVATPAMLPVPMVAARAVDRAWNWEIALASLVEVTDLFLKIASQVLLLVSLASLIWKKPVRRVR
jgi:hypothetical protein